MFEKSFLQFAHFTLRYILQKVFFIPKYAREAVGVRFSVRQSLLNVCRMYIGTNTGHTTLERKTAGETDRTVPIVAKFTFGTHSII